VTLDEQQLPSASACRREQILHGPQFLVALEEEPRLPPGGGH
jgi:hypothetical protein